MRRLPSSDWVAAYRRRAVASREYFVAATSAQAVMEAIRRGLPRLRDDYALTLQAGAGLVQRYAQFDAVDVYARSVEAGEAPADCLKARAVERGANLRIGLPYYRVSGFYGVRVAEGLPAVSNLQFYLDLYDHPLRGREQAEQIFKRRLRRELQAAERG